MTEIRPETIRAADDIYRGITKGRRYIIGPPDAYFLMDGAEYYYGTIRVAMPFSVIGEKEFARFTQAVIDNENERLGEVDRIVWRSKPEVRLYTDGHWAREIMVCRYRAAFFKAGHYVFMHTGDEAPPLFIGGIAAPCRTLEDLIRSHDVAEDFERDAFTADAASNYRKLHRIGSGNTWMT